MSQQDAEKTSVVTTEQKAGVVRRGKGFLEFLEKVRQEMKLVHWPDWPEVRSTTLVVIAFVFLFAFYLRALDWILSPLDRWIFNH